MRDMLRLERAVDVRPAQTIFPLRILIFTELSVQANPFESPVFFFPNSDAVWSTMDHSRGISGMYFTMRTIIEMFSDFLS